MTRGNGAGPAPTFSQAYLRYALGLLCVVYVVNFLDRQILAILLQSIKEELQLTDVQLGLLSGTAFGLFYATLGIPIARLADRVSRKAVIAVCLTLWSGMTLLCGTAGSFAMLFLFRIGVGVGEAGGSPPSHSLLSDYFPPERRATALGIFALGAPVGNLIGYLFGGWLDETVGWRLAFFCAGAPGLVLAALVALTLREPRRGGAESLDAPTNDGEAPPLSQVFRFLWQSRAFRHLSAAAGLNALASYSIITWSPAFLIRTHEMGTAETGAWLALAIGVMGGAGSYVGGVLCDRWGLLDVRGRVWLPGLGIAIGVPFALLCFATSSQAVALGALALANFFGGWVQGPMFAGAQFLATPQMRATASALLLFATNIVGLTLGPATAGALSDAFAPYFGARSLAVALFCISFLVWWAALHFYLAGRTFKADLERAQRAATGAL